MLGSSTHVGSELHISFVEFTISQHQLLNKSWEMPSRFPGYVGNQHFALYTFGEAIPNCMRIHVRITQLEE